MSVKIVSVSDRRGAVVIEAFLRRPAFDSGAEAVARRALGDIRKRGNPAVLDCVRRFQNARLTATRLRARDGEVAAACRNVDRAARRAIIASAQRVAAFARAGLRKDWSMPTPRGGRVGERFVPLDRVGVYIPGGAAPLASTVVMTATLARVAGVKEIVACTPCAPDGTVNPALLFAMKTAGVTEIYRVGGIQAIGLMAYGTQTVRKVQKIVGPGGTYVTAAKRLVYGDVSLDMVAGPSEIAVLADDSADPRLVAADLLSQAEHGSGWEKALLVTSSARLARAVVVELEQQARRLGRYEAVKRVMARGGILAVVAPSVDACAEVCNRFAPEHLELMVRNPCRVVKKIRAAGAIFVGPWTPESAGDFVAGPSHVLPTGGTAALFSGLTADDFRRRSSVIELTRGDLKQVLPVIEAFGRMEGLDAHAKSASIRFSL